MVAMICLFIVLIHAGRIALSVLVRGARGGEGWEGQDLGGMDVCANFTGVSGVFSTFYSAYHNISVWM